MKALIASRILINGSWQKQKAVVIDDREIHSVISQDSIPSDCETTDLGDVSIAPGFFDIQVNGGGGVLLNEMPTVDGIKTVSAAHRQYGTTSLLPTLISDSWDKMLKMADAIEEARTRQMPGIRGVHFEGPYLNTDRKGVHPARYIRKSEEKFLDLIQGRNLGAIHVTLAPEMVSTDFISALVNNNVKVSAGHTAATYEETQSAIAAGLTGITHLFNAMSPMLSRDPGVVGAALSNQNCYCGIIVDGHHVHPATLKSAIAAKTVDRMILVTDAMPPVGTDITKFVLGDIEVNVSNGRCTTADGTLAGSVLSMKDAVQNSVSSLGIPFTSALQMASTTPAKFMGLSNEIGNIGKGMSAEFVCYSNEGELISVI